jgi:hypothetical protein
MTIRLPISTRNVANDAVADLVDSGPGPGLLRIYTGSQPASADLAPIGALLATFTTNDPAFGTSGTGTANLIVAPAISSIGIAPGDAGWFRLLDSTGVTVFDGSVTAPGGGGDMIMNTVTVSVGLALQLTAGSITTPAS